MAVLNPGDECVLIEPLYDTYLPVVKLLGAIPRLVRLSPPNWELPRAELAAAFGPKTKAILFNSPMNPTGKVFTAAELAFIADLVAKHDCYAICDEVYEHLTFDGWKHIPLMTLPGMRERCMRDRLRRQDLQPDRLEGRLHHLRPLAGRQCRQGAPEPDLHHAAQPAARRGGRAVQGRRLLRRPLRHLQAKRDRLAAGLAALGFGVLPTQGSYFITTDFRPLGFTGDDVAFCRALTEEAGVTAIPVTAFYASARPQPLRPLRLLQGRRHHRRRAGAAGEALQTLTHEGPRASGRAARSRS